MIKKLFVLCLCVFLSGCCHKNNKNIVIKFSTWGSASELAILKPIISEFEANNKNVKIELIHIPQDYFQKIHLLFASNLAPDVIFMNNLNLPVYADYLEDLSGYARPDEFYKKSIESLSYTGKLCAMPRDVSNLVIYYNKALFRQCGVKYPSENWLLEDMIETAFLFKSKGFFGISYEPDVYYALPYMLYFGGGIISDEGKDISGNSFSQKGISTYKDLAYRYCIAPRPSQVGSKTIAQMFLDGRIAMHLSGRWLTPKYRTCADFDWDIINFPEYNVPCDASGWAVAKSSKNKDIAIKFVLFLSNKENIEKMTRSGLIVPARVDVSQSSVFLSGMPEHSYLFIKSIENSKIIRIPKDYRNLTDSINDLVFNSGG